MAKSLQDEIIDSIYLYYLGRHVDPEGLKTWLTFLNDGWPIERVVEAIKNSQEAVNRQEALNFASSNQQRETEVANFFHEVLDAKLVVVDIGAQNLAFEKHVYHRLTEHGLIELIVGFEPLLDRAKEREGAENKVVMHPYALGDGKPHTLYVNNFDETSSFYRLNEEFIKNIEKVDSLETIKTIEMKTTRLDDVKLPKRVDLLKIDVQGFELLILQNALKTLANTSAVYCELEFRHVYEDQPLAHEVIEHLHNENFELCDVLNQVKLRTINAANSLPLAAPSRLAWGDGYFIKSYGKLPTHSLIGQACLSHFLFDQYDLAYDLLLLADEAMSKNLSDKYRKLLGSG